MMSLPDFMEKHFLFVFANKGEKLSFSNDNLIVKNNEGKIVHQSTCYRLFAVSIVGNVTVTSGLLQRVEKFGFTLILMNNGFRVYGTWAAKTEGNFLLRAKQYTYSSLSIASYLIRNKIENQKNLLKRTRNKNEQTKKTIKRLEGYVKHLAEENLELKEILGFEGIASREYFKVLFKDCNWTARRPRVKQDPINSLQDTGYTILFNFIESLLNLYGFDVYKGVYHQCFYQRKSLVCDIVEPFRPIIDARIKKAYCLGQIKNEDFTIVNKQYRILGKTGKPYIEWLLREILSYKKPMFLFIQQYYRCFVNERPIEEYPVFLLSDK